MSTHTQCLCRKVLTGAFAAISRARSMSALQRSLISSVVTHPNLLGHGVGGVQTGRCARIKGVDRVILRPHVDLKSQIAAGRPDIRGIPFRGCPPSGGVGGRGKEVGRPQTPEGTPHRVRKQQRAEPSNRGSFQYGARCDVWSIQGRGGRGGCRPRVRCVRAVGGWMWGGRRNSCRLDN